MAENKTGNEYADQSLNPKYDKMTYSEVDCQAFCELVLKDIGVRRSNGKPYNWRGSNHIARVACKWLGTVEEALSQFGEIPRGAWVFKWADDGGERERGYSDGKGNYKHIGIYIGNDQVRDSTRYKNSSGEYVRNGPGTCSMKGFNRVGLAQVLDFDVNTDYNKPDESVTGIIAQIRNLLNDLERRL